MTFMGTTTAEPVALADAQMERKLNVGKLLKISKKIHPLVQHILARGRAQSRAAASCGTFANFEKVDFFLMTREDVGARNKLLLLWRGSLCILKAHIDYVCQFQALCKGHVDDILAICLKFYCNDAIDDRAIMQHVLQSEIWMPVAQLTDLEDNLGVLQVHFRKKKLESYEDTVEPFKNVFEEVLDLFKRLFQRENIPSDLVEKARSAFSL